MDKVLAAGLFIAFVGLIAYLVKRNRSGAAGTGGRDRPGKDQQK